MDRISFGFVLMIVLVGGLTAYIADLLGRMLGKKRLSIFNLRPKHTAILITTLAGLVIPLFTVTALFSLSREVRTWLVEGQNAVEERDRKVSELAIATQEAKKKAQEVSYLENQKAESTSKLNEANQQVSKFRQKAEELKHKSTLLNLQIKHFQTKLQFVQKKIEALDFKNKSLTKSSQSLHVQNKELQKNRSKILLDLKSKETEFSALQTNVYELHTRVDNLNRQKHEISIQFDRLNQQFNKEIELALKDLEFARKEKEKAEHSIKELDQLKTRLTETLDDNARRTRLSPLIFSKGEELARINLKPYLSEQETREYLNDLISLSDQFALSRRGLNSKLNKNGAGLVELPVDNGKISIQAQIDKIVKNASMKKERQVLIASALWNTYEDEFVILNIDYYKNPLVYKQGQVVSTHTVDGTSSEKTILESINNFLNEKIHKDVQEGKMIPSGSPTAPQYIASYDNAFDLLKNIRNLNKRVKIQAIAKKDTYASDNLLLEFKIL